MQFEAYAACFECWAPQSICHSWTAVESGSLQRYQRTKGTWRCQFQDVLRSTVAAAVAIGQAEDIEEFVEARAAEDKVDLRQDVEGIERWRPWLGKKVRVGSTETSGLGRILWEFAAYREEQAERKEGLGIGGAMSQWQF